jgi:hypothetical protein
MADQPSNAVIAIPKRMRMAWTDAIAFDREVSDSAYRVACIIGAHFNRYSGETFISQKTIAKLVNKTDRTVRTAIFELERLGYLEVGRRELGVRMSDGRRVCGGKGAANTYRPTFEPARLNATDRGHRLLATVEQSLKSAKEEINFPPPGEQRRKNDTPKAGGGFLPTLESNPINTGQAIDSLVDLGEHLRLMVGNTQFRFWFRDVRIEGVTGDTLRLSAPSKFVKDWLMQHYREAIITCWQKMHSAGVLYLEIIVISSPPVSARGEP